jgi:hypothetical protein
MQRHVQSNVVTSIQDVQELRVEAEGIEATYGPNAYSDYLRRHGQRPDPISAAAIGRHLGGRVKANDGSMQPVPVRAVRQRMARRQA